MQAEKTIYYGKLTKTARRELSAVLDSYADQWVRINIEQLEEDHSDPVRLMLPEKTRDRLKRSKFKFNALRDKPLSTAQYLNYLLDMEERKQNYQEGLMS